MDNSEINPQKQFVVSYNDNDFYCNLIGLNILKQIDNNITNVDDFCKDPVTSSIFYKTNNCSNELIYDNNNLPKSKCAIMNQICQNKKNQENLKELQTTHSAANSRYQDMDSFYNTEVLKTANLGIGILILVSIIYRNL